MEFRGGGDVRYKTDRQIDRDSTYYQPRGARYKLWSSAVYDIHWPNGMGLPLIT